MVLPWSCHGAIMMLSLCCHGAIMMLSLYCHGAVMVQSWWCHCAVMVQSWCCYGCNHDAVMMLYHSANCANSLRILRQKVRTWFVALTSYLFLLGTAGRVAFKTWYRLSLSRLHFDSSWFFRYLLFYIWRKDRLELRFIPVFMKSLLWSLFSLTLFSSKWLRNTIFKISWHKTNFFYLVKFRKFLQRYELFLATKIAQLF